MLFEACAQKEYICGSYSLVTGFTEKSENLPAFGWHGRYPSILSNDMILPHHNAWLHTAQQMWNLIQKFSWQTLDCPVVIFGTQQFSCFLPQGPLVNTSFHLWCRSQTCCCHVADTTGTYLLCIWDGQTYHMPWHIPQPLRGLCWKIVCQWRVHCVLSVSCIQIVPLVYGYSNLTSCTFLMKEKYNET
jgi:hypothetical protein